jgi:hypothetical protein
LLLAMARLSWRRYDATERMRSSSSDKARVMVSLPARRPPGVALRAAGALAGVLPFFADVSRLPPSIPERVWSRAQRLPVPRQQGLRRPLRLLSPSAGEQASCSARRRRFFLGGLAGLFLCLALFGSFALAADPLFFDAAAARFFFGVLAGFFFSEFRVRSARCSALLFRPR